MTIQTDIIIIGAGPAGLSFARSMSDTQLKITLIERAPLDSLKNPPPDGREIAITHSSHDILAAMGVWSRIPKKDIAPINHAKVLSGDSSYSLDFDAKQHSDEPLGFLVPNFLIRKSLYEEVSQLPRTTLLTDTTVDDLTITDAGCVAQLSSGDKIHASLVVAADSRFSTFRKRMGIPAEMRDFSRVAIVCRMHHENPHNKTATEHFQYGQTMAALPMNGNQSSVVITIRSDQSQQILDMDEKRFNAFVEKHLAQIYGQMTLQGERYHYPLVGVHAKRFVALRFALLGDAAVGMHPVTAHGFNLGLRGQNTLHKKISQALRRGEEYFSPLVLEKYQRTHMRATRPIYHGTNAIVGLFTNDNKPAKLLRDITLRVANNFPPIKQLITQKLTEKNTGFPFF